MHWNYLRNVCLDSQNLLLHLYQANQEDVEQQIFSDIINITKRDRPNMVNKVVEQLKSGGIMQYNYVLYCDPNFDNKDIVTEITGE